MLAERWSRFVPTRSRLMLILGVAVVVGVLFVLADLVLTERSMKGRYLRAEATVEQLQAQQVELQQDLERAQQGQNIPEQAFEQFGMAPQGAGVVVLKPETAPAAPSATRKVPFWVEWWRSLGNP